MIRIFLVLESLLLTDHICGIFTGISLQTENTVSDSFDLYYGLFMYNVNATEQMDKLDRAFDDVKQMLYGRLHGVLRKQIVERVPMPGAPSSRSREGRESPAANTQETKPLSPSPCHTFSTVAFSTAKC
uniref:TYRAAT2-like C-terminal domain-containing protein n=1 Tax=Aegilops tauschii subsp. strangulata TaxID=200361 RepID=A0A453S6L8_AEGTS